MKKINFLLVCISLLSLFIVSCEKDDDKKNNKEGEVTFSFEAKSLLKSTNADASAVVVSIEDNTGNPVYSSEKVELYSFNGQYISKPLSLVPGSYTLTQYLVLDAADNIIYVTPLEGSAKAYLVSDPLPIGFTISKDNVTKVVPEVLSTENASPEDFGYVSTSFDIVETFDFLIGVFIYNETIENFEMTDASISISGDGSVIYTGIVEALTDTITLRDGYAEYEITVEKSGYETWVDTFVNAELKLYYSSEDEGPLEVVLSSFCSDCPSIVYDIDGNVYNTILIGEQCWLRENLNTTKYNNGDLIPNILDTDDWITLSTGAYCHYNNDPIYASTYGKLYNFYAVNDSRKLCPAGWHIPTDDEWKILEMYLGMSQEQADAMGYRGTDEGGKLKEIGTTHWMSPNTGATNISGFTALPAGIRGFNGDFGWVNGFTVWWSSTDAGSANAFDRELVFNYAYITRQAALNIVGLSVRCIKDEE